MLMYGSDIWTLETSDKSRIRAAEMKFMRKTAQYSYFVRSQG